jgi:hypothetical protein
MNKVKYENRWNDAGRGNPKLLKKSHVSVPILLSQMSLKILNN